MSPSKIRVCNGAVLIVILAALVWPTQPAAACEIAFLPNFRYEEHYSFEENRFPPGLSVNLTRPEWVEAEGLVGFMQLANQGTADIYLLFAFELGSAAGALTDGQRVDSSVWSRGLVLKPGDTFDIIGEGNLMQFAPGLEPVNVNNIDGNAQPPDLDPLPTQSGQLYLVADQRLNIVPFTIAYGDNPAYKPEGSFQPYTLAQKVASAPVIALGEALQEAGYDSRASTTVRVKQWLKGTGNREITVSGFGSTSCDYQIEAGAKRVFFLAPDGDGYRLNGFQAGMFDAMVRPEDVDNIAAITGQAAPAPANETSPSGAASLWLFGGPSLLLFVVGSTYLWRRYRGGRRV